MKLLKWCSSLGMALALVTQVEAHGHRINHCLMNYHCGMKGVYLGASGGLDIGSMRTHLQQGLYLLPSTPSDVFISLPVQFNNPEYALQLFLGPQLGYRYQHKRFSLGTEVFIQGGGPKNTMNATGHHWAVRLAEGAEVGGIIVTDLNFKTQMQYGYGIRLLPGYVVHSKLLAFGILGLGVAHFKNQLEMNVSSISTIPNNGEAFAKSVVNKMALQLGAGAEVAVGKRLGLGFRYIYGYYGRTSTAIDQPIQLVTQTPIPQTVTIYGGSSATRYISNHEVAMTLNYYGS